VVQRLYRSTSKKIIAGVCGGLGDYLRMDPVLVRIFFVLLAFAKGIGVIAYLAAWVLVPKQDPGEEAAAPVSYESWHRYLPGLVLVAIGALLLMREHLFWFDFEEIWPLLLVLAGLALIVRGFRAHQRRQTEEMEPNNHTVRGENGGSIS
jgi:phage shock protein C